MTRTTPRLLTAALICLLAPMLTFADTSEVTGILKELGSGNPKGITKAAKQLGDIDIGSLADAVLSDGDILSKLTELAGSSKHKAVSKAAGGALEKLGPELGGRIPGLLDDPDNASKLFDTLGGLGAHGAGATGQLLDVVGDADLDPGLRSEAIGALGDIGSKGQDGSVEKALQRASEDSNADVSSSAKQALDKLGG